MMLLYMKLFYIIIFNITIQIIPITYGAQSKGLASRHTKNKDVGCQIIQKTANWFVTHANKQASSPERSLDVQ